MKVSEFEQKVWELDGIRIILRADSNDEVGEYERVRAVAQSSSIAEFIENRVKKHIGDVDVVVVDGRGTIPRRNSLVSTIRETYNRE
ncbi:hypothetical protein [Magnetospirillum molischianum]|nr:hypothetical protein [Magnetospirillum molischianum]